LRRGRTQSTQRRRGKAKKEGIGLPFWRVGSFCINEWVAWYGRFWQVLAGRACLPSPMARLCEGRRGRLGKAWHPAVVPEGVRKGEEVGLSVRMVSLHPMGRWCAAVRVFRGETRFCGGYRGFFRLGPVALCASRARTEG
jgi:hypothetical protein